MYGAGIAGFGSWTTSTGNPVSSDKAGGVFAEGSELAKTQSQEKQAARVESLERAAMPMAVEGEAAGQEIKATDFQKSDIQANQVKAYVKTLTSDCTDVASILVICVEDNKTADFIGMEKEKEARYITNGFICLQNPLDGPGLLGVNKRLITGKLQKAKSAWQTLVKRDGSPLTDKEANMLCELKFAIHENGKKKHVLLSVLNPQMAEAIIQADATKPHDVIGEAVEIEIFLTCLNLLNVDVDTQWEKFITSMEKSEKLSNLIDIAGHAPNSFVAYNYFNLTFMSKAEALGSKAIKEQKSLAIAYANASDSYESLHEIAGKLDDRIPPIEIGEERLHYNNACVIVMIQMRTDQQKLTDPQKNEIAQELGKPERQAQIKGIIDFIETKDYIAYDPAATFHKAIDELMSDPEATRKTAVETEIRDLEKNPSEETTALLKIKKQELETIKAYLKFREQAVKPQLDELNKVKYIEKLKCQLDCLEEWQRELESLPVSDQAVIQGGAQFSSIFEATRHACEPEGKKFKATKSKQLPIETTRAIAQQAKEKSAFLQSYETLWAEAPSFEDFQTASATKIQAHLRGFQARKPQAEQASQAAQGS